ncbi:Zn-ribbon domain-containing OB-fold protein [Williamsia muralis]|uniref:OB-fold domain-containing protein n=1 Tax=Williamsia marianensis TaxID=85044 RepID=A0ABU4EZ35_WILMA|nr:OB-fold domain-containing protein [Williamsia muralis]MDV7136530.1 OB-fold domain-containing protein [Williamsia muralis]
MTIPYVRPEFRMLPAPTPQSQDYWAGGRDGELLIHRCHTCQNFFLPGAPVCWRCRSTDVAPEPVSGRGSVAAFTVNRQTWIPVFPPPYTVALIELAEQPDARVVSNIVDIDPADVTIGLEVEVFFEEWEDVWIPLFRPVDVSRPAKESN